MRTCITTNKVVNDDFIEFRCPNCGERITRSLDARKRSLTYTCKCGFTGP